MQTIKIQHKIKHNYEDFKNYRCEHCGFGFFKKWPTAMQIKNIHIEERIKDRSVENYDQPQIEDQIKVMNIFRVLGPGI